MATAIVNPQTSTAGRRGPRTPDRWPVVRRALFRSPGRVVGAVIIVVFVLTAIAGPWFYPSHLPVNAHDIYASPSLAHPLGTDFEGTDVLALVIVGARYVLLSAAVAGLITIVVGVVIGLAAGYLRRVVDSVLSRLIDFVLTMPTLPLLVILAAVTRFTSPWLIGVILGVTGWAGLARAVRSQALSLRERPFVEASRGLGMPTRHVLFRELLPNIAPYVAMNLLVSIVGAIYAETGLFFLGVLPATVSNWGVMLNLAVFSAGAIGSSQAVFYLLAPLVAILLLTLGIVLILDAVDEIFNPRLAPMRALRAPAQGGLASDIVSGTVDGVEIRGLRVVFPTDAGELPAVSDVDLDLPAGTITGLVGESGSGKSTLALAMLNAVPKPGRIAAGSIRLPTVEDVTTLQGAALRRARGTALGYVFQASQSSLNPLKRIGAQLLDVGRAHGVDDRHVLLGRAKDLCERMGLDATRVLAAYQHELSGGMRQRVGIVFALVLNAKVLVLDEPTTALDMLSQAAVLEIVREIHKERNLSTLIITHDIAIVADLADRLAVMYGGRLVEQGPTQEVLRHPSHPYARGLLAAMPRISGDIDEAQPLTGRPPDLASVPQVGCVFRERCPLRVERCDRDEPALVAVGSESSWPSGPTPSWPSGPTPSWPSGPTPSWPSGPTPSSPSGQVSTPHGVACHVTAPVSDHDASPDGSESS